MTDDEAKDAILALLTTRPVTVDMVQVAANAALADDPERLNKFGKWLERFGLQFCAAINKIPSPSGQDGLILGDIHAGSEERIIESCKPQA